MLASLRWIGTAIATLTLLGGARAQAGLGLDPEPQAKAKTELGGRTSIDLLRIHGATPSLPLRNAGVLAGSETIELDGQILRRGVDYAVDYAQGTLFLMRPVRAGQAIRATYRYDQERAIEASKAPRSALGGFSFDFAPGASAMIGFGMVERQMDGSVLSSNVYGLKTNFGFQGVKTQGFFAVSDRQEVQSESLYEYEGKKKAQDLGRSQAIVQNLGFGAMGGRIEADFQDVRANFRAFQAFRNAGFDEGAVQRLQAERGLKRVGLRFADIGAKTLNFSSSLKRVDDSDASVEWRSFGVKAGAFQVEWNGRRVDRDFKRFKDIAEEDRDLLTREQGMNTESVAGSLKLAGGEASFHNLKVEEDDGSSFHRRRVALEQRGFKVGFSDQHVEQSFDRFQALRDVDAGQLARERGLRRQSLWLETPAGPRLPVAARFASDSLRADGGDLRSVDFGLSGARWSVEKWSRAIDPGFHAMGSLSDGEVGAHIDAIARMYETGKERPRGEERGQFLSGTGIERHGYRAKLELSKGLNLLADGLRIEGARDSGTVKRYELTTPRIALRYREQTMGDGLEELDRLMEFERHRLSTIRGLQKTDLALDLRLDGDRRVEASSMRAGAREGEVSRQSLAYHDQGIDASWTRRTVDEGFAAVGSIVDPERELLAGLRGFNQSDFNLRYRLKSYLAVTANWSEARDGKDERRRVFRDTRIEWNPFRATRLKYQSVHVRNDDPYELLEGQIVQRASVFQEVGKFGSVLYEQEDRVMDGVQGDQPDSKKQRVVLEGDVNPKTKVRTEQVKTRFEDGGKEDVSSQTLSTELNKRTGVSLTETRVRRGEKPSETARNYGFWWDFGKGLRLNYGYARNLKDEAMGTLDSNVSLTAGTFQGLKVEQMSYQSQRWDEGRTRHTGNVAIGTVAPLQLGFMRDVNFFVGANTLRDRDRWESENQRMGLGWRIGTTNFGLGYTSQINPHGDRAIDRVFTFATDQSETAPLRATVNYKLRTLPNSDQVMIRDYRFSWRPTKGFEISHELQTNPERQQGNVLLGSVAQPQRINRWKLDYTARAEFKAGLNFEEMIHDRDRSIARAAGVNVTLFASNPSPLHLYYGLEQSERDRVRRTNHRYWLRFDQRPGPNQSFSMFVGNVSWQHTRPDDQRLQNWSARLEYQIRF
jgi:hypothetical protein